MHKISDMKHYGIYLFDFDYTLADSSAGIVMCFRKVLTSNGFTGISDEAIKKTIGKTLEDSFEVLTGVTDKTSLAAYKEEYRREADAHMTPNTKLFPETKEVLTELKKRGAKIGIISTKYRYTIEELLDREFSQGFFDIVVGGEDVAAPKPSPEGLLYALARLTGKTENTLYIGDSVIDAKTAVAGGTDFFGVLHGTTSRKELAAYPHVEIAEDLTALIV